MFRLLSSDNLSVGGLSKNSLIKITGRPDMTLAADWRCKALNQINKSNPTVTFCVFRSLHGAVVLLLVL